MSNGEPKTFIEDERVVVQFSPRWGNGYEYKEAKVVRVYKNGNFRVWIQNETAPLDLQFNQPRGLLNDHASQAGAGYGASVHAWTPESIAKLKMSQRRRRLQFRLDKVKEAVAKLVVGDKPTEQHAHDLDGLVGALETALGIRKELPSG